MRQKTKALVSILIALSVLCSYTVMAAAAGPTLVSSGQGTNFTWEYYSDHELKIAASKTKLDLSGILANVVSSTTSITIDIANAELYSFYGENCLEIITSENYKALSKITLVDSDNIDEITYLTLRSMPKNIKSFNAPEGVVFDRAYVPSSQAESEDFLTSFNYGGIMIDGCSTKNLKLSPNATWLEIYGGGNLETLVLPDNLNYAIIHHANNLQSLTLNENLTNLGLEDVNLESITVPKNCRANFEDVNLKTATIESGAKFIGYGMFSNCYDLESVSIPSSVTTIEYFAFSSCKSLKSILLPEKLTSIYRGAFSHSGLTSVTIPSKVTEINSFVFRGCKDLTSVTVPEGITKVYNSSFFECDSLSQVNYLGSPEEWNYIRVINEDFYDEIKTCKTASECFNGVTPTFAKSNKYITKNPVDFTGNVGETAKFSVTAGGTNLAYQWQYNNGSGWKNSNSTGYNTSTLSVKITDTRDGQLYRCVITDKSGTKTVKVASDAAAIHTSYAGKIVKQPEDYEDLLGKKATFTVEAEGTGLTYQWQYKTTNGTWKNSNSAGYDTPSISVKITEARNGQQYRCIITNSAGKKITSDAATIIVKEPDIVITKQPVNASGYIGEDAVFTVEATGEGLTYKWQYSVGLGWQDFTDNTVCNTNTLTVKITDDIERYSYHCVITDKYGKKAYPDFVTIKLKCDAEITSQPTDYYGVVGEKAVFSVKASGDNLTYQWQYFRDKEWKNSSSSGYNTDTLTVKITEARYGQTYRCKITDSNGVSVCTNSVCIIKKADAIDILTQPADFSGSVGDMATFTVETNCADATYQWQYYKDGKWKNSGSTGYDTNTLSIKITEARNYQEYRCIITDSSGNSVTSGSGMIIIAE